jgi:hypothetical protein
VSASLTMISPSGNLSYPVLWTCFPIPIVTICSLSNMVRCMDPIRCTYLVWSGLVQSNPIYDKLCNPFPVHIMLYTAYSFIQ